ncbi:unnamed protein product [Prunus armeniaca]|uniref:Uncharacterized protein n=1 Tax=Prunus armeniaca TaxID=36596 RepID=A0A6J5WQ05_PRUAR|nr:unnamed protein product [Prunus armeniaca]
MGRKGQSTTSMEVAAMAEAKLDAQRELWDSQLQEVQAAVTAIALQQAVVQTNMTEVQQTLVAQQDQNTAFQKSILEEIRALEIHRNHQAIRTTRLPPDHCYSNRALLRRHQQPRWGFQEVLD